MFYSDVIIVGGGPAGSSCAWKLKQAGIDCIILDKETFPRSKVCAGWITPKIIKDLGFKPNDYPHNLLAFNKIHFNIYGKMLPIKTFQYSIRRYEFDKWLLDRSGVPVYKHRVRKIKQSSEGYLVDDEYFCKHLVGAGGTDCPVYRTFFQFTIPRKETLLIIALADEFKYDHKDENCYLWFFKNKLPGYSWYVPKGNGYINIGIGGIYHKLLKRNITIRDQWNYFIHELSDLSLVKQYNHTPRGYYYYLRQSIWIGHINNVYIIGDSAGLATKDLGEGIGPAVKSGILAANSIINTTGYYLHTITRYSIPNLVINGLVNYEDQVQKVL